MVHQNFPPPKFSCVRYQSFICQKFLNEEFAKFSLSNIHAIWYIYDIHFVCIIMSVRDTELTAEYSTKLEPGIN